MFQLYFLQWREIEQFLNEIDMRQDHAAAAVSFKAQRIQRITLQVFGLKVDSL